jgi:hypothetical protein
MLHKAQALHKSTPNAKRYRHFDFCQRRTEGPGYEAKFTRAPGDRRNVTYYFDEQGNCVAIGGITCIF